ncbi:MAG TPA: hypothetical protein PKL57_21405, partial [Candidatus Wallbacteria bacterium]|nr:hypothetical protein [Candidatus Wallbacteria bacterium]
FIYKARRASPSLNYSLSTMHYSLINFPEGFSNESPKKLVWRPAPNYQLKCKGTIKNMYSMKKI